MRKACAPRRLAARTDMSGEVNRNNRIRTINMKDDI